MQTRRAGQRLPHDCHSGRSIQPGSDRQSAGPVYHGCRLLAAPAVLLSQGMPALIQDASQPGAPTLKGRLGCVCPARRPLRRTGRCAWTSTSPCKAAGWGWIQRSRCAWRRRPAKPTCCGCRRGLRGYIRRAQLCDRGRSKRAASGGRQDRAGRVGAGRDRAGPV